MNKEETQHRVGNAKEVLGHPHYMHGFSEEVMSEKLPCREGEHYKVLASTDWGGYFVPTVVKWNNGGSRLI